MVLVASETGHVYTFATQKLQPMITSDAGKALIQTCLNTPDGGLGAAAAALNSRMTETGYEEQDLTFNAARDDEDDDDIAQSGDDDDLEDAEHLQVQLSKEATPDEEEYVITHPLIATESVPPKKLEVKQESMSAIVNQVPLVDTPPVMTIPPHVLDQLMKSSNPPPSSSGSLILPPNSSASATLDFLNLQAKFNSSTSSSTTPSSSHFRPIEPKLMNVPPAPLLNLKPVPPGHRSLPPAPDTAALIHQRNNPKLVQKKFSML